MAKDVTKFALGLLALFIALGDIDRLLGVGSAIGPIHILAALFVTLHLLLHVKDISIVVSLEAYLLLLLVFILAIAQLSYGTGTFDIAIVNFKLIVCVVFFLILAQHLSRYPDHVNISLAVFAIGCVVLGFSAFVIPGVGEIYKGQFIILGENPNSTSSRMAVAFVFVFSYVLHNKPAYFKASLCYIALIMLAVVIVKSGSRGSLLAVILSSLLLAVLAPLPKIHKASLLLLIAVGLIFLAQKILSIEGIGERWISALQGDTAGRSQIWASAFEIFLEHPWIGVGEGGYFSEIYNREYRYIDAHNLFIYVAVSGGLIGLFILIFFLTRLAYKAFKPLLAGDALPMILLFNMLFIAAKTGGVLTYLLLWFIFAMVFGGQFRQLDDAHYKRNKQGV